MAIQENYIDKITKDGESRPISPAADKVRVDNDNFEGDNLDDVLDEIHTAIGNAGSGDGTVTGVKVGNTPYSPDGEGVVDLSTPFNAKVDKETGKSLMTDAERTKLQNLPTDPVSSITVNGQAQQKDQNGNVNIVVPSGGESIVFDTEGTPIIDSPLSANAETTLGAASARWVKEIDNNVKAILAALAGIAFTSTKPTWQTVAKRKYNLTMTALTGCTGEVVSGDAGNGQVYEGGVRIKLTPTQASYAFTSVTVNGESVATTATGDADGSVYLDIVVNGNITVAATAISGRGITFNGTGCSIGAAGVAIGQDLDTTITANEHFTLPASITVKIGKANVTHTYTRAQDNKTATLHIDAANITGDLTITCTAVEEAHAVLNLSNVGSGVTVNKANNAHIYAGDTITILPASGNKVTASATVGGNAVTLNGNAYGGYTYTIGSSDVSSGGTTIAITATASSLQTFSIDLSGVTSDVGVTWNTPSAAVSTILEGSPFSVTLAKVSGTGVLQISTSTMGSETLTPNNGTIDTDHVAGDITISASVAAAPMKVHSYDFTNVQLTDGRVDGKPKYIEDDVAGHFRLYNKSDIVNNAEATEDDPAWTAPGWSPSSGSYKGSWANGISNNYRAGYGNRVLDLEPGKDFTIILKGYALYPATGNRYDSGQIHVMFYDRANIEVGTQLVAQQFHVKCGIAGSGSAVITNTGAMYPLIVVSDSSDAFVLGGTDNAAAVPAQPGDYVYDVVFSYVAQTGLMSAFVVKRGSSSEVLVGGTMTKTGLAITCMQVYGYGPSVPTYLKGIELYNYAMDKSALETLYGITNNG